MATVRERLIAQTTQQNKNHTIPVKTTEKKKSGIIAFIKEFISWIKTNWYSSQTKTGNIIRKKKGLKQLSKEEGIYRIKNRRKIKKEKKKKPKTIEDHVRAFFKKIEPEIVQLLEEDVEKKLNQTKEAIVKQFNSET